MEKKEVRYVSFAEFRADGDDGEMTIRGHAATFGDIYNLGAFSERVAHGAFDKVLDDDVRALYNHDSNYVLGRTKSGTLRISVTERGLMTEIDLPKSAVTVREAVARGDVDQMSIGFTVKRDSWEVLEDGRDLRTIEEFDHLFDVSPVAYPANKDTDLSVARRSLEAAQQERTPEPEAIPFNKKAALDLKLREDLK